MTPPRRTADLLVGARGFDRLALRLGLRGTWEGGQLSFVVIDGELALDMGELAGLGLVVRSLEILDVVAEGLRSREPEVVQPAVGAALRLLAEIDVVLLSVRKAWPLGQVRGRPFELEHVRARVQPNLHRAGPVGPRVVLVDQPPVFEHAAARALHSAATAIADQDLVVDVLRLAIVGVAATITARAGPRGRAVGLFFGDILVGPRGAALVDLHRSESSRIDASRREPRDARRAGCAAAEGRADLCVCAEVRSRVRSAPPIASELPTDHFARRTALQHAEGAARLTSGGTACGRWAPGPKLVRLQDEARPDAKGSSHQRLRHREPEIAGK